MAMVIITHLGQEAMVVQQYRAPHPSTEAVVLIQMATNGRMLMQIGLFAFLVVVMVTLTQQTPASGVTPMVILSEMNTTSK